MSFCKDGPLVLKYLGHRTVGGRNSVTLGYPCRLSGKFQADFHASNPFYYTHKVDGFSTGTNKTIYRRRIILYQ
jgi:hypothetical protein